MEQTKLVIQLITTEEELLNVLDRIVEKKLLRYLPESPCEESQSGADELLTTKQIAKFFQVSETTIHTWKNSGILPFVKVNSRIRFKKSAILGLDEKRRNKLNK